MGHSVFCFCRKHTNHEVLDRRCPRGCCRCRCRLRLWRLRLRPWLLPRLDSDRRTEEVSRHFLIFRHKLFSMKMPKTLKKINSCRYEIKKKKFVEKKKKKKKKKKK